MTALQFGILSMQCIDFWQRSSVNIGAARDILAELELPIAAFLACAGLTPGECCKGVWICQTKDAVWLILQ
jgi:hypothetical protein